MERDEVPYALTLHLVKQKPSPATKAGDISQLRLISEPELPMVHGGKTSVRMNRNGNSSVSFQGSRKRFSPTLF